MGIPYHYSDQVHSLPPIYAKALLTWNMSHNPPAILHTFKYYLPALHSLYNTKIFVEP
jgi:hypothetical protein